MPEEQDYKTFLLPAGYRLAGYLILLFSLAVLLLTLLMKIFFSVDVDVNDPVRFAYLGIAAGLLLIASSAESIENYLIEKIRSESLLVSLIISTAFIIILEMIKAFTGKPQTSAVDFIIIMIALYILLFQYRLKKLINYLKKKEEENE